MYAHSYLLLSAFFLTCDLLPILCYALWAIQGCMSLWPSTCIHLTRHDTVCMTCTSWTYQSHAMHYWPSSVCPYYDVGPALVIGAICLFHYAIHLWASIFTLNSYFRPIGKENESLHIWLPLMYLSWHVFRDL